MIPACGMTLCLSIRFKLKPNFSAVLTFSWTFLLTAKRSEKTWIQRGIQDLFQWLKLEKRLVAMPLHVSHLSILWGQRRLNTPLASMTNKKGKQKSTLFLLLIFCSVSIKQWAMSIENNSFLYIFNFYLRLSFSQLQKSYSHEWPHDLFI